MRLAGYTRVWFGKLIWRPSPTISHPTLPQPPDPQGRIYNHIMSFPCSHPAVAPIMLRIRFQIPPWPTRPFGVRAPLTPLPSSPITPVLLDSPLASGLPHTRSLPPQNLSTRTLAPSLLTAWNTLSLALQSADSSLAFVSQPPLQRRPRDAQPPFHALLPYRLVSLPLHRTCTQDVLVECQLNN